MTLSTIGSINKMYRQIPEIIQSESIFKITVSSLVDRAGISRGSFYANFTDMSDFIEKYENDLIKAVQVAPRVMSEYIGKTQKNPDEKYAYMIYLDLTKNISKYLVYFQTIMKAHGDPRFMKKFQRGLIDTLFQAVDDESFNNDFFKDVPADYAMPIYFANVIVVLEHWLTKDNPESPEIVAKIIAQSRYSKPSSLFDLEKKSNRFF